MTSPSNSLRKLVHRPQQVWLRKALFQIHLWVGLLLSLYVVLIGFSGSVLVFRQELTHLAENLPRQQARGEQHFMNVGLAIETVQRRFPGKELTFLSAPSKEESVFDAYLLEKGETTLARLDAIDGKPLTVMSTEHSALGLVGRLHYYLLLDRTTGLLVNGLGAALLLTLAITGIVIWWPGLRVWQRGLRVDFRKSWKRINFDSHSAVGFWTLAIVSFWALSGVFFVWPQQVTKFVSFFSKVSPELQKVVSVRSHSGKQADPEKMIKAAESLYPGKRLAAVAPARESREPFTIYMTDPSESDLRNADFVYFDPASGAHVDTVHRGIKRTVGDWIIWSMYPLHFGTSWGMSVKVLYALLGLSLPVLSITGVLMYWNRYLRKKWRQVSMPAPALSECIAQRQDY